MKPALGKASDYEHWTNNELVARLVELEDKLQTKNPSNAPLQRPVPPKAFNFSAHPVRKIALKFCYSGWEYNGLTFQKLPTPLPTVEEVLFQALTKTRLIDPDAGYEGCGWERCGRTDRGVSAGGQVMSLWVRSALGGAKSDAPEDANTSPKMQSQDIIAEVSHDEAHPQGMQSSKVADNILEPREEKQLTPVRTKQELNYIHLLNRVLPPTIRVLAWSPVASTFSSRFNCRKRHYKYFFSSGGLDLSLMRDGAQRLVGEHDFRNYCKIDPAKQISNYHRRVVSADINPVDEAQGLYVLDLVGSAFLWHQVRHIMAILFLVGTGLEHPSVVSALLNVNPDKLATPLIVRDGDPPLEKVECKPDYQMADALPLMLWDCEFAESDVQWRTIPDGEGATAKHGVGSDVYDHLDSIQSRSLIHTTLDAHFLSAASQLHPPSPAYFPRSQIQGKLPSVIQVPVGGGMSKREGNYRPLLRRRRMESADTLNERWRLTKGDKKLEKRQVEAVEDDVEE